MINFHRLKPVLLKIACRAQIRKQILFRKLLLRAVGQALHRDHAGGEFIVAQDHSVARPQAIREAERFSEFHLDRRQLHYEARPARARPAANSEGRPGRPPPGGGGAPPATSAAPDSCNESTSRSVPMAN